MPKVCMIAGVGVNDCKGNVKDNPHYLRWDSMLRRCYQPTSHNMMRTYYDCSVSEDWLIFSNFERWSLLNYKPDFQLDKDILIKGNKIYGEDGCCYLPKDLNVIFLVRAICRGDLPLGVSKMGTSAGGKHYERVKPYIAKVNRVGKTINLGYFLSPKEAHRAWQEAKVVEIESVLGLHRHRLERGDVVKAIEDRIRSLKDDIVAGRETYSF
jgi:hypothetical protein